MKRLAFITLAGMLIGCEGAVLVNNRPERGNMNTGGPTPAQTASERQSPSDMNIEDGARTAASTQPADQTVETKNTRIESHSD
jgi:hypothetical protein